MNHSRTLIHLQGPDSKSLLQGILTQDIALLESQPAIFTAMLSPQGKWQHDFFVFSGDDSSIYIDCETEISAILFKRLKLYKLRADVQLALCEGWHFALLDDAQAAPSGAICFADPRHPALPKRAWSQGEIAPNMSAAEYAALRLRLGIPEGGIDVTEKETALDVTYDLLHGVSFTKGCYVGQEVTARMHYKSVIRKGFFCVHAETDLPTDAHDITLDGRTILDLRSRSGPLGLAYGRLESALAAMDNAADMRVGGVPITLSTPDWQAEKITKFRAAAAEKAGAANG